MKVVHQPTVMWSAASKFYLLIVKVKRDVGRIGGWEERLKVISPLDGGGQEVILTLIQGGGNFILRPTLLILEPPPPDNYCTVPKLYTCSSFFFPAKFLLCNKNLFTWWMNVFTCIGLPTK